MKMSGKFIYKSLLVIVFSLSFYFVYNVFEGNYVYAEQFCNNECPSRTCAQEGYCFLCNNNYDNYCDTGRGYCNCGGTACDSDDDCGGSHAWGSCQPCGDPVPSGSSPVGWLDPVDCNAFYGWARDDDNINVPIDVHFYADGVFVGGTNANTRSEAGVCGSSASCSVCGDGSTPLDQSTYPQCFHRFNGFPTPLSLKDGNNHEIRAYGININSTGAVVGSGNAELCGSGGNCGSTSKIINCTNPNVAPTATINGQKVSPPPNVVLVTPGMNYINDGDLLRFNSTASDANSNLSSLHLRYFGDGSPSIPITTIRSTTCSGLCSSLSLSNIDFNTNGLSGGTGRNLYFSSEAVDQAGATGGSATIIVHVRPTLSISGVLYNAPNVGVCSANSPAILNSNATVSARSNSGAFYYGSVQADGNFAIKGIPYGTIILDMCVSINPPPTGEYRLSCVNGENAYPWVGCYQLSNSLNMTSNKTSHVGLRLVAQNPWFTSLYSDVYGGNGIIQSVPAPPLSPSTFAGYLGDWAAVSANGEMSYAFTAMNGSLNINAVGRSGRIYKQMSGLPSETKGGFAMRMPFAADKMWPSEYLSLRLPSHGLVTQINDKSSLNSINPGSVRVYRIMKSDLFDSAGTTYNLSGPGTAVLYYTETTPLKINGRITSSAADERIYIVSTAAPIEISPSIGIGAPTTGTLPHIQAGLITTAPGANNVIKYLTNGSTDISVVVEGPVITKRVDMQRNIGNVNSEIYPTNVHVYNSQYIYRLTRQERSSMDVPNYTGISIVDINWEWLN